MGIMEVSGPVFLKNMGKDDCRVSDPNIAGTISGKTEKGLILEVLSPQAGFD